MGASERETEREREADRQSEKHFCHVHSFLNGLPACSASILIRFEDAERIRTLLVENNRLILDKLNPPISNVR